MKDVFKACGYFVVSNTLVILVEISTDGSAARCAAAGGGPNGLTQNSRPKWQEIKYNKESEPYVRFYDMLIPMDHVMRI